ncbi:hypothetical protein TSUD_72580 [Trifolium subterraneum]|uniref:Uncharacterized protein n=1 Tax=Trifolium subterraneum TaxID=3900 RepID=A0A2Z6MLU1_TRISU|nr:hypothetical protein TSUD_72580 [Trifolium subterraneum]
MSQPSAAATGFPVSFKSSTTDAGTGFPVSFKSSTPAEYSGATTTAYAPPLSKPLVEWSTSLCDCCSDPGICN